MLAIAAALLIGGGSAFSAPDGEPAPAAPVPEGDEQERLDLIRRDIETLRGGIAALSGTEEGILGDLKALEAESLRREQALAELDTRIRRTGDEIASAAERARESARRAEGMREPVMRRLRALYRLGAPRYLRVFLASERPSDLLAGYRAAASLSERDRILMTTYRRESGEAKREAERLADLRARLVTEKAQRRRAATEAVAALEKKRALLLTIRSDREIQKSALEEMLAAEESLGQMLAGLPRPDGSPPPTIGFDSLHGLLDWPVEGRVSAGFGRQLNPRFGTALEHNGLDIEAPLGAPIRAVQDGLVVFSQWFRGYGLTVILDHGGGWLSVYAHGSALVVQKGERVRRGQKIALTGDSGSLREPHVYFEIRKDGKPVDPSSWLRPR